MKITIDKKNTTISQLSNVKERIKEFKSYFTDSDLLRMFNENTDRYIGGDIIKCDIEAYSSSYLDDDVSFYVEIVLDELVCFTRIRFFIDSKDNTFAFHDDYRTITVRTYDENGLMTHYKNYYASKGSQKLGYSERTVYRLHGFALLKLKEV